MGTGDFDGDLGGDPVQCDRQHFGGPSGVAGVGTGWGVA